MTETTVTPEIDYKAAFQNLIKRLHQKATERNYCEDFDDVIEALNEDLPEGAKIPGSKMATTVPMSFRVNLVVPGDWMEADGTFPAHGRGEDLTRQRLREAGFLKDGEIANGAAFIQWLATQKITSVDELDIDWPSTARVSPFV